MHRLGFWFSSSLGRGWIIGFAYSGHSLTGQDVTIVPIAVFRFYFLLLIPLRHISPSVYQSPKSSARLVPEIKGMSISALIVVRF